MEIFLFILTSAFLLAFVLAIIFGRRSDKKVMEEMDDTELIYHKDWQKFEG